MSRGMLPLLAIGLVLSGAMGSANASADPFSEHNCGDRLVLCLTPTGASFGRERKESVRAGERLHVIVLGQATNATISIELHVATSSNSLLPQQRVRVAAAPPAPPPAKLAERLFEIPAGRELTIYVVQTPPDAKPLHGSTTLQIEDALYFARPGLAFTWVDRGSRVITAEDAIVEGSDFFPGIALTIWPWGHRSRTLSGLEKLALRSLGDAIALQIGSDLDFSTPFERAFFGVTFEPVSGIGISGGLAVTTGQFFSSAPSGSTMAVVDRPMLRPYVSLTLTPELLDTLRALTGSKSE